MTRFDSIPLPHDRPTVAWRVLMGPAPAERMAAPKRHLASGWWIMPFALAGAAIWGLILWVLA